MYEQKSIFENGPNLDVQSPLAGVQSIFERFNPRHLALADEIAKRSQEKNDLGGLYMNAKNGITVDVQDKMNLESKLAELTANFTEANKDLDETQFRNASDQFIAEVTGKQPQREEAKLENPNALQSGFALLGSVLFPDQAADIAAVPFQYQLAERERKQGVNDQRYSDQVRQRGERIDAAQTKMTVEERRLGKQEASRDRNLSNIRMMMGDVQDRISKLDTRIQASIQQAYSQYNAANTPEEKMRSGQRLQQILGSVQPELAPTNEEIQKDAQYLQNQNVQKASQQWELAMRDEANAFGEVSEQRAAELENQRRSIAQAYGIDVNVLRPVRTGKTLAAEKFALTQKQFAFLKTKTAEDFKLKWANYQVAKDRAQTYAQAVANGFYLGTGRLGVAQGHLSMRQAEFEAKGVLNSSQGEMQKLLDENAKWSSIYAKFPTEENKKKADKAKSELQSFGMQIATEFGISEQEIMSDPLGTIKKVIELMDEEEQNQEEGFAPFAPLQGQINPTPKPSNPKAKPKPKPKPKGLPSGWRYNG